MNDFSFSLMQHAIGVGSLLILLALLKWGRSPEKIAAAALSITMYGTPLLDWIEIAGVRVAASGISLGLFLTLLILSVRADRWWLLAAAGVQLLSIATWGLTFATAEVEVWAGVTIRLIVWVLLMLTAIIGIFEARTAPYATQSN